MNGPSVWMERINPPIPLQRLPIGQFHFSRQNLIGYHVKERVQLSNWLEMAEKTCIRKVIISVN